MRPLFEGSMHCVMTVYNLIELYSVNFSNIQDHHNTWKFKLIKISTVCIHMVMMTGLVLHMKMLFQL